MGRQGQAGKCKLLLLLLLQTKLKAFNCAGFDDASLNCSS
jgi:hypothetical protein